MISTNSISIILLVLPLLLQKPGMDRKSFLSSNGRYVADISGLAYEGFAGPQRISLIEMDTNDTLWSDQFSPNFLQYPCVSNVGDVAIVNRSLSIFDKNHMLKGVCNLDSGYFPLNYSIAYNDAIEGFSQSGDRYYLFVQSSNNGQDAILLCFSDSAKEIWRDNIGHFNPTNLLFYHDKIVVFNRVNNYPDDCLILTKDDDSLWSYKRQHGGRMSILMDSIGFLLIRDGNIQTSIRLDSLHAP